MATSGDFFMPRTCGRQAASTVAVVGPHCSTPCPRPVAVCVTTVAGGDTIWADNNGEREKPPPERDPTKP
jgi:hypothetical protein